MIYVIFSYYTILKYCLDKGCIIWLHYTVQVCTNWKIQNNHLLMSLPVHCVKVPEQKHPAVKLIQLFWPRKEYAWTRLSQPKIECCKAPKDAFISPKVKVLQASGWQLERIHNKAWLSWRVEIDCICCSEATLEETLWVVEPMIWILPCKFNGHWDDQIHQSTGVVSAGCH